MSIEYIAIVSIPVRDQDAAKAFYTDTLGFAVVRDNPMGPGRRWIELAPTKGSGASITLVTWFDAMPPGSVQGLVVQVSDLEGTRKALADRGLETGPIIEQPYGCFSMFTDPDGNGWVLQGAPRTA